MDLRRLPGFRPLLSILFSLDYAAVGEADDRNS